MLYQFTKMHGLGNDFVVFDAVNQQLEMDAAKAQYIADRHFGIGCDQILLVERTRSANTSFYYRIFNADGSEVEQCGNGARCFARFVREQGLSQDDILHVGTQSGEITLYYEKNDQIRVNMGIPVLSPEKIPFNAPAQAEQYDIQLDGKKYPIGAVSMGNPHAILIVDDVERALVNTLGPDIQQLSDFPQGVNVGFMEIIDRATIRLRVYERGAAETLACGSGACAAVVSGILRNKLDNLVSVYLPGGKLLIQWDNNNQPVWMTGPATRVFSGAIEL